MMTGSEFLIYDITKDELVPLTQVRLDELLAVEQAYGRLINEIDSHRGRLKTKILAINGNKDAQDLITEHSKADLRRVQEMMRLRSKHLVADATGPWTPLAPW